MPSHPRSIGRRQKGRQIAEEAAGRLRRPENAGTRAALRLPGPPGACIICVLSTGRSSLISRNSWQTLAFSALFGFFYASIRHLGEVTDDAFISFRYAKHLVDGLGMVFNEGAQVEGYTNFLWTLAMAAGYALGLDPPRFSQTLGCLLGAALVLSLIGFSRRRSRSEPLPAVDFLAATLIATNPLFIHHVGNGLETVFFTLLTLLSFLSWADQTPNQRPWRTGVLLGLSYLVRPDALLWVAMFVSIDVGGAVLRGERSLRSLPGTVRYAGIFALIAGMHLVWRLHYYGDWLPNTFYVKVGSNWHWGMYNLALFGPAMAVLTLSALALGPLRLRTKWALCAALIVGGDLLFILRNGGAGGRYAVALLPLIYLLVQEVVRFALLRARSLAGPRVVAAWAGIAATVLVLAVPNIVHEWRRSRTSVSFSRFAMEENQRLAECLVRVTESDDAIAVIAAGVFPFYAERPIIDMLGLNDRHIAYRGQVDRSSLIGHQRFDSEYVLSRSPRIVLIRSDSNRRIAAVVDLLESQAFHRRYAETTLPCEGPQLRAFVDRDRPLDQAAEHP